jgi:hypothetical protein
LAQILFDNAINFTSATGFAIKSDAHPECFYQTVDSECENDYSDISSECDSDFSVQDEDNLEQAGVTENTEPKQGETHNADHDENSSVIELMREFIATEEMAG